MKKLSVYGRLCIILFSASVLFVILGWFPGFCDWYSDNIFRYICDGVSRITGTVPFAIGEIIMYIGAAAVVFALIFLILFIFLRKKTGFRRFCKAYFKSLLLALICIVFIYILFWFIPLRGNVLGKENTGGRTEYQHDEILALYNYIVDGANSAAEEIMTAEDGTVIFPERETSQTHIADAMRALSDEYPRLAGYYPPTKTALCSDILNRMNIAGYNYPYTMEPTCSKYLSPLQRMLTDSHELSHHKGFFKENEANFISETALTESDDPYLRLAGFMDMYRYVADDLSETETVLINDLTEQGKLKYPDLNNNEEIRKYVNALTKALGHHSVLSARVYAILYEAEKIETEIYEADEHPIDNMATVEEVITTTSDKGWEIQDVILDDNSYDGVTLLLLQYFDGRLY